MGFSLMEEGRSTVWTCVYHCNQGPRSKKLRGVLGKEELPQRVESYSLLFSHVKMAGAISKYTTNPPGLPPSVGCVHYLSDL